MATFAADLYLNTDGTHWFKYKDHSTGSVATGGGGGGPAPMLIGMNWLTYDAMDTTYNNPTGSKTGGINTGMSVRRAYQSNGIGWPCVFSTSVCSGDAGGSRTTKSQWSHSDTSGAAGPATFASGAQNSNLTAFWNSVPAGHALDATFWHEAYDKGVDPATYQAAYVNIHSTLMASSADTSLVRCGGIETSGSWRGGHAANDYLDPAYHMFSGIDYYHYYEPDPASPYYGQSGSTNQRTAAYLAGDAAAWGTTHSKPLVVCEWGVRPDPGNHAFRPGIIAADIAYLDTVNCESICMFSSQIGAKAPWWWDAFENWSDFTDHTSNPDPDSITAIRNALSTHAKYTE